MWVVANVERGCMIFEPRRTASIEANQYICRDMGTCLFGGFVWYG